MGNITQEDKIPQVFFDIPIFTWEGWDQLDFGVLQFYNVEFQYESMKQYNGCDCSLDLNGRLIITQQEEQIDEDTFNSIEVWEGFVCEIPEFLEIVNKRYKG